jgi:hypothetical protein
MKLYDQTGEMGQQGEKKIMKCANCKTAFNADDFFCGRYERCGMMPVLLPVWQRKIHNGQAEGWR